MEYPPKVIDVKAIVSSQDDTFIDFVRTGRLVQSSIPLPDLLPRSSTEELVLNPAITIDPLFEMPSHFVPRKKLLETFGNWLLRMDAQPPPWDLFQANLIHFSEQARRLNIAVTDAISNHSSLFSIYSIIKIFPASGATCLLRSVAYHQAKDNPPLQVMWINSVNKRASQSQLLESLSGTIKKSRLLICTDELGKRKSAMLSSALQMYNQSRDEKVRIVWLQLRASTLTEWSQTKSLDVVVSPYVEEKDIQGLTSCLAQLGHAEELEEVATTALQSGSSQESRHMFVFVLAATQGISVPISKWLSSIYNTLKRSTELLNVALSIAFVSAFSPQQHQFQHQFVSDEPLKSIFPINDNEMERCFRQLFPKQPYQCVVESTFSKEDASYCLHPFLARLFLSKHFDLRWNNDFLDWKALSDAWKLTVEVLKPHAKCYSPLRMILSERGSALFSPLVIEAWSSVSTKTPNAPMNVVDDYIVPVLFSKDLPSHIMGAPHKDILLSRLYRCSAQMSRKPNESLEKAIRSAGEATKNMQTAPLQVQFHALQNLAVMHGLIH